MEPVDTVQLASTLVTEGADGNGFTVIVPVAFTVPEQLPVNGIL